MSQGKTIQELEENLKDAYLMMVLDDVLDNYQIKMEVTHCQLYCLSRFPGWNPFPLQPLGCITDAERMLS
jgi:hypothetical protein